MKKWIIAGLAVLVVLILGYASFSYFFQNSHSEIIESKQVVKLININTATQAELESLKGVGPVISQRIIKGRPYNDISDILKVNGIGPKKFAKMKDIIIVEEN